MKHIKYFNENKTENNLSKEYFSSEKLEEDSFNKIDYYYLKASVDKNIVKEMSDMIEDSEYRAFATFVNNIKHFEDLNCTLIALVNYPAERFNKRTIINRLDEIKQYPFVDEVEFPWSLKYIEFGVDFWRDIIVDFVSKGFILRPMVEFGVYTDDEIKNVIEFFKKINILNIMTSSGLYPDITTFERWKKIKEFIPTKWEVKIGGVLTLNDINKFIKNDVDLVGTTISLKYKE